MSQITKEQAHEIILKNYPQIKNGNGQVRLERFKEVDPEGFAVVLKKFPWKNGISTVIHKLRKAGRLNGTNGTNTTATPPAPASAPAGTFASKEAFFVALRERFGVGNIKWSVVRTEMPEAVSQFKLDTKQGYKSILREWGYFWLRERKIATRKPRPAKLKLPQAEVLSAPTQSQMHYCPNCAFPIGMVIQAVNTLSKLKRP